MTLAGHLAYNLTRPSLTQPCVISLVYSICKLRDPSYVPKILPVCKKPRVILYLKKKRRYHAYCQTHWQFTKIWRYHFQGFCAISIYSNIKGEVDLRILDIDDPKISQKRVQ